MLFRSIRGIDVSDEALSVETIRETCLGGPNHFLGNLQTLGRMQKEYVYPMVGDRSSPKEWTEKGRQSAIARARAKLKPILDTHFPRHLPNSVDNAIRQKFPVRLPREAMGPR